jgi:superfamily II DNA or RNA helicase
MIGLSATPYRQDGLDILLDVYFGRRRIVRELHTKHTVYAIQTALAPPLTQTAAGTMDWNAVLQWQAIHPERNDMICRIACAMTTRRILILCKRRHHVDVLHTLLRESEQSVTTLAGHAKTFDTEARILIGTTSKIGTGFSHNALDTLILASDVQSYYIQVVGRILRRPDVDPLVVDIVDDHPVLKRHFLTRKRVYEGIGGHVTRTFSRDYPGVDLL